MGLFNQFMHQIVPEAIKRDIQVRVLVSDGRKFPTHIVEAIQEIEGKTKHCRAFNLNICVRYAEGVLLPCMLPGFDRRLGRLNVSYGARDEIVGACKRIAAEVSRGETSVEDIDEGLVSQRLLTAYVPF